MWSNVSDINLPRHALAHTVLIRIEGGWKQMLEHTELTLHSCYKNKTHAENFIVHIWRKFIIYHQRVSRWQSGRRFLWALAVEKRLFQLFLDSFRLIFLSRWDSTAKRQKPAPCWLSWAYFLFPPKISRFPVTWLNTVAFLLRFVYYTTRSFALPPRMFIV